MDQTISQEAYDVVIDTFIFQEQLYRIIKTEGRHWWKEAMLNYLYHISLIKG